MSAVAALTAMSKPVKGAKNVIRRFTFRRVIVSAVIFGWIATAESIAQAVGIVAAFPNAAERAKVINGLASNNALGVFYGDRHVDILSPGGYMVYRILPIVALVLSIWSLTFITKMLRGQEENGRWELLLAGETSQSRATIDTILGAAGGILLIFVLNIFVLAAAGQAPKIGLPASGSVMYSLATVAGPAVALGVGAVTSQLAATRRRAIMYGLAFLLAMFLLRSVGNIVDSLTWLKNLTPFGWIDKLHPYTQPAPVWLLPLAGIALLGCWLAVRLAARRDMMESYIADSATATPHVKLLNSQAGFDFRQMRNVLFGWLFASLVLASLIAGIDKTVANTITSTGGFGKSFSRLSGNPNAHIELAYLGAAAYLIVTVLMLLVTNGIGAVRDEEASGRLDNFVSGTVSRTRWLTTRLILLVLGAAAITMISNAVIWLIARAQNIDVSFVTLVFESLSILGPVIFLLGVGTLLMGLKPRLATGVMYLIIGWSFTIDIIASAIKANKYLSDTSLLHHLALVPAATPKWGAFAVMAALGVGMIALGVLLFSSRDLEAE